MASRSVSEDTRETRDQMALASDELATSFRLLAAAILFTPKPELVDEALELAELFERLKSWARSDEYISETNLRSVGRAYESIAIKLSEACELAAHVVTGSSVALDHAQHRLKRMGQLTGEIFILVGVSL